MTTTTSSSTDFDVQTLEDTVRGEFSGKNAFMGSALVSQGGIMVNPTMPQSGKQSIGNTVTVPYFGTLGAFSDNPEDTAAVPQQLQRTNEQSAIVRSSLAFEVSVWAQGSGPADVDPYEECTRQIKVAAEREIDRRCLVEAATTELVTDVYAVGASPVTLDWDTIVEGRAMYGDEDEDIVGMCTHSRALADLRKLRDSQGRPLLVESFKAGEVTQFCGIPVIVSDKVSLVGSTMGTVTEVGAVVGNVGFTGTPLGAFDFRIDMVGAGSRGVATFRFSTNGGRTWSETLLTAATVVLTDTSADSLVGQNGLTGLTATFGVATYDAASVYSSTANLKVNTMLIQKASLSFWFNADKMNLQTDKDILKDNDVAAMHMYGVPHLYRRRRGGSRPGVVSILHNVGTYNGA